MTEPKQRTIRGGWKLSLDPWVLVVATLLGAVSGLAASLVRLGFVGLQWCFTHNTHELPIAAMSLPPWRRVLIPVLGGLCAAVVLMVRRWHAGKLGRKPRDFVDYVEAVRLEHGRIPFVPNCWRTFSSAFSVATGAAIGREGSMIQFAAATGSFMSRLGRCRWNWVRRMPAGFAVACGVAGGVTTAYQAPVAGVLFAAEIVLGELQPDVFLPLGLASAAGWGVSRLLLEPGPLYPVGQVLVIHGWQWIELPLLGLALGALAPMYQRWLRVFRPLRNLPLALALGGLVVGLLSLWEPRVWGNGDVALADALGLGAASALPWGVKAMLAVLGARLLATGFDVGVGTVGGVFTPTMFAGATLGALAALALGYGGASDAVVLFAIFGLSALIAAATHAPLMASCMAAELTGHWHLWPLLAAVDVLAWLVARSLSPTALYAIASQAPVHKGLAAPHTRPQAQQPAPAAFASR